MLVKLLYRVDEVAVIIGRCRSEVYDLLKSGKLKGHNPNPGKKGIRVTAESIKHYIEQYQVKTEKV